MGLREMNALKMCLSNDICGINIVEDADLQGFKLVDPFSGYTCYTAYVAEGGYSSYVAIPDIFKGIDCEDEKPLVENVPLFTAVAKIKAHHFACGMSHKYPRIQELWEGAQAELCGFGK